MPVPPDDPRSLRDVLALIRQRPAMYLGSKSLTALSQFVFGYSFACRVHATLEANQLELTGLDSVFLKWLAAEHGIGEGARSPFYDLVERHGDETMAFDRFFELLDEYEASATGRNVGM